jgi:hypothetical protein
MAEQSETLGGLLKQCLPRERRDECEFAALFIALVIQFRTVNLNALASHVPGNALLASRYTRLQRLFIRFTINPAAIVALILSKLALTNLTLIIDRTNWKIGHKDINILVIAVRYHGTAIPLIWDFLEHKGNSSQDTRIDLFGKLLDCLPSQYKIEMVLGGGPAR